MEREPTLDNGKKISLQIYKEDEAYFKRDRFENKVITEPSEEAANIFVKKAQIEAPLGIPLYHESTARPCNQACSSRSWGSHIGKGACGSRGELPDTESLRDQINSIAKLHGLDGVPLEAAAILNNGSDKYIKRIVRPCINSIHSGSYQIRMQDSEVPMQMNEQWLGDMSSLTGNTLNELFPNTATIDGPIAFGAMGNTGIDLNQEPTSDPNSQSLSSGGTDGTETSTEANMEIDLNLSLDVDIDLNLSLDVLPVLPVASMSGSLGIGLAGICVGSEISTSLTQGPVPLLLPPWAPNLTSSGNAADTSVGMHMAHNLTSIGSGPAACMDGDIPDYLSCIGSDAVTSTREDPEVLACAGLGSGTDTSTGSIFFIGSPEQSNIEIIANQMESYVGSDVATNAGRNVPEHLQYAGQSSGTGTDSIFFIGSPEQGDNESMENEMDWYIGSGVDTSTGRDMPQNLVSAGRSADTNTGTHSIFFIGSPEQGDTESTANQMEWAENVNGIRHTGVGSADTLSGVDNHNGAGQIHRTITLQDFQTAMLMNPQVLGTNWPVMLEDLLSHSFEE